MTAAKISLVGIDFGATLRIVNSSMPNGGVSRPSCMQIRYTTPNQSGSHLKNCTSGMKNGSVMSIMLTWSTKQPRNSSIAIMPASTAHAGKPAPCTSATMPLVAPENDRICENVVAPMMMNRMMPVIAAVPLSACAIAFQVRLLYSRQTSTVASTPSAADSVGVAQPADIATMTRMKISTSGVTLTSSGPQRAQPCASSRSKVGACSGWRKALVMIQTRNIAASNMPGTTPAISRPEIEMPARLPSSTVSADGGISMSTPPIAMIGPIARRGW